MSQTATQFLKTEQFNALQYATIKHHTSVDVFWKFLVFDLWKLAAKNTVLLYTDDASIKLDQKLQQMLLTWEVNS